MKAPLTLQWRVLTPALLLACAALVAALVFLPPAAMAANPSSGSLGPGSTAPVTWVGTQPGGVNPGPQTGEESHDQFCDELPSSCETFVLEVSGQPGDWDGKQIRVGLNWTLPTTDYDMYVHRGSETGPVVARSASGPTNAESDTINPGIFLDPDPATGITTFYVHVIYFTASGTADPYTGTAAVEEKSVETGLQLAPIANVTPPRYQNHTPTQEQIAAGMTRNTSDEPNIGCNHITGAVMFQALLQTLRVTWNDDACAQTPPSIWVDKSPATSVTSFDPILFTDPVTGRTVVSQLLANPIVGASSVSDNDGETWTPSNGAGIGSGIDHQTVGGGPFHVPLTTGVAYQHAVYYCSQDIALANCALSLNGGITYGPSVPIYDLTQCGGLHGHIKVAPDGTAYVPNSTCFGQINDNEQAVVVSEDNGSTWEVRTVAGSVDGDGSDPSVDIDKTGRVYLGYMSGDEVPAVAVSEDKGKTWKNMWDVGTMVGVKTGVFPAMVAGDDGRAAVAFYGTKDVDTNAVPANFRFQGTWHLYVAHTYDAGASWVTVNATPNDPLQRGGLHLGGGGDVHRNLLDFFDATVDKQGRMVVGYADGCRDACVQAPATARGNSYGAFGTIARQTGGPRLFGQFDPVNSTTPPGAPRLTVTRNGSTANITWSQSEDGGLPITGYKLFRAAGGGAEQLIANLDASATGYVDKSANPANTYTYRVAASNNLGESCGTNAVSADPRGSSCARPGIRLVDDAAGDHLGGDPAMDIQWLAIAEPFYEDGSRKLEFTMKVASLQNLPTNAMWRIQWGYPDAPSETTSGFVGRYYAGMNTDASGQVSFEYGMIQNDTTLVLVNLLPPVRLGEADGESGFNPDGTIRIVLSADKIGNPDAGDVLGAILGRTFPVAQDATLRSDSAADSVTFALTYGLVGNASCKPKEPTTECFEQDDAAITYANGWHEANSAGASDGSFGFKPGKNTAQGVSFTFTVAEGATGTLTYHYGQSTDGGSAEVWIDGALKETVSYRGPSGSKKDPQFGATGTYGGLEPGTHTFELRNVTGPAYVDGFCLESSFFTGTAAVGPGETSSSTSTIGAALESVQTVVAPAGSQAIAVYVEAASAVPLQVVVLDPAGSLLGSVKTSTGTAVIEKPASQAGTYLIKVLNLSLGPVQVRTLVTPWGTR